MGRSGNGDAGSPRSDGERGKRLIDSGLDEGRKGNFATSAAIFAEAADTFAASGDPARQAFALTWRARGLVMSQQLDEALVAARVACQLAADADDSGAQAAALAVVVEVLRRMRRWSEVLPAADQAIKVMKEYGHRDGLAVTLLARAVAEYKLGRQEVSLATTAEARAAFRADAHFQGVISADDHAITVNIALCRYEQALALASANLVAQEAGTDALAAAYAERRLGEAHLAASRCAAAHEHFGRARDRYRSADDPGGAAGCSIHIARTFLAEGHFDSAEQEYLAAAVVLDAVGHDRWLQTANRERAGVLYELCRYGESSAIDADLLRDALDGAGKPSSRDADILVRCVSAMVLNDDAEGAGALLQRVKARFAADDLRVAAALCWTSWHAGEKASAAEEAMRLLAHDDIADEGLAQAWILHVAGTVITDQPEGVHYLARALVIYRDMSEIQQGDVVAQALLRLTSGPRPPGQGHFGLTS